MIHDPIVEEVRAIRERLAAEFDFDIRRIIDDARRRQVLSGSRLISLRPVTPPDPSGAQAYPEQAGERS